MESASHRDGEMLLGRMAAIDWMHIAAALDEFGYATAPALLRPGECDALAGLYVEEPLFRKRVVMSRHGFGSGEYKYFTNPLPGLVAKLRNGLYPPLAAIANSWQEMLGLDLRYPEDHMAYLDQCRRAGQTRPTPLLLSYGPGDYNRLHQDIYGELLFPLQAIVMLSDPSRDFTGGELLVTEQSLRRQSRAEVVPLAKGDAAFLPACERPVAGARGNYRAAMRHGVSRVRTGHRRTLGIIFHDAA